MKKNNQRRAAPKAPEWFGVPVIAADSRGSVLAANAPARRLFGWSRTRNISASLLDVPPFLRVIGRCRSLPGEVVNESFFEHGDKTYKILGRSERGTDNAAVHLALLDITREKEAERVKTEFVALASHQLRTPLSVMKWILEKIERRGASPFGELKRELRRIRASNEGMIALVNDLLNVTRLEAGKLIPEFAVVDLRSMAEHIVGEFRPKAQGSGVAVAFHAAPRPVPASLDPKFIHEIISNLVSNAVKYTPAGGKVLVQLRAASRSVTLEISDSGAGIPRREQGHVFEKFFRGENVAGTEIEGTGLGLYIAKTMTRSLGGTIAYAPRPGGGSRFTLTFPRPRKLRAA